MSEHRLIALLPMKAHSERIPGKNFRLLAGKPLFQWILETLLSLDEISRVVINTDARDELERHAAVNQPRVLIRDRRPELCGDLVSMNLVLADDVAAVTADMYLMTHTTNPLLSAGTLRLALDKFNMARDGDTVDSLFGVTRHQARFYDRVGRPVNHNPGNLIRTQDLDPLFEENSTLYIFTHQSFSSSNARIGRRPMMFETPDLESIDIDDASDWSLAEALIAAQR